MKLYLICEDIDLGYHVYGIFTDKTVAETQIELLIEATAKERFFGQERPENYREYFRIYIEEHTLDDLSNINKLIEDKQRALDLYENLHQNPFKTTAS